MRPVLIGLFLSLFFLSSLIDETISASNIAISTPVAVDDIIRRLDEQNRLRETKLKNYTNWRTYRVTNNRFRKESEVEVEVKYISPATKLFNVTSQKGSGALRNSVINKLLDGEKEAMQEQVKRSSAVTTDNYEFTYAGEEIINGYHTYVLSAKPRRKDKYLFQGRIWIDSKEFAIVRVAGSPAKNPSFWTRKIDFVREYKKVDQFWLPARDESVSEVFMFGRSVLSINYGEYQVNR